MTPSAIAFYITGHGFGHAARSVEVINALLESEPSLKVFVCSQAPAWFFEAKIEGKYTLRPVALDAGAVERDLFETDPAATLQQYQEYEDQRSEILTHELEFLKRESIQLVLFDTPPDAALLAHQAGIPTIAIANFGWDFIYTAWHNEHPEFAPIVEQFRDAYRQTTLLLKLPLSESMEAFPNQRDLPLIAHHGSEAATSVLDDLPFSNDENLPLILYLTRQQPLGPEAIQRVAEETKSHLMTPHNPSFQHPHVHHLGPEWRDKMNDLIAAVDVVVSKPGYGIIAECIANRTRFVHVPRLGFAEADCLLAGMEGSVVQHQLSKPDFVEGNWAEALKDVLSQNPNDLPTTLANGAAKAAEVIRGYLN